MNIPFSVNRLCTTLAPSDVYINRMVREATEVGTTHLGAPGGLGAPWWVVPPSGHPQVLLWPIGSLLAHKKSTKSFAVFGLRLILISCKAKNSNWHWALGQ